MTMSGNHIEDVHVTALTFSELLRLYLEDHCEVDMENVRISLKLIVQESLYRIWFAWQ